MVRWLFILEWILLLNRHSVNGGRLVAGCVVRQAFRIEDDLSLLFFRILLTGLLLSWPTGVRRQYIGIAGYRCRLNLRHGQARIILFMFIAHGCCLLEVSLCLDINDIAHLL